MNKFNKIREELRDKYKNKLVINFSPASSFRARCEFSYQKNQYVMHEFDKKIYINKFNDASLCIQRLMPILLNKINNSEEIKFKLFQINFRSNQKNKIMITLIYHKAIDDSLIDKINALSNELGINIIIRSKNFIYGTTDLFLEDYLLYKKLIIYQTDNCFTQPNKFLVNKMIHKVIDYINKPNDLLELYCGVGTFTLPLSFIFKNVFATENNRDSIKCLKKSLDKNNILNIHHARLSSNEVSELINGRVFKRMNGKNINDYKFSHILLDPPRSGLSPEVVELVTGFKNIIYVSCNPETYLRDINLLKKHKVKKIELFDQFPNKKHLEIVSILEKN